MFTITYTGTCQGTAELEQELSLLHAARRAGIDLPHRCGGHARCGTCKVVVGSGAEHLSPPGTAEARVLKALKAGPDTRLACQAWAQGNAQVQVG